MFDFLSKSSFLLETLAFGSSFGKGTKSEFRVERRRLSLKKVMKPGLSLVLILDDFLCSVSAFLKANEQTVRSVRSV